MSSPLPPSRIRRSAVLRAAVAGAALIGAAWCLAGCGAGFDSASLQVQPDSGSAQIGGMRINGVVVVTDSAGDNAEIVAAVANTGRGPGRLTAVLANGFPATVRPATSPAPIVDLPGHDVTFAGDSVTIAGGAAVSFGQPGRPALDIPGGSFVPGHFTQVEFGFAGVGQTSVNALIMRDTGLYNGYDVNPTGSGASPGPTVSSTAGPTAGVTRSPALAKVSTTLVPAPHPYGSREPRR